MQTKKERQARTRSPANTGVRGEGCAHMALARPLRPPPEWSRGRLLIHVRFSQAPVWQVPIRVGVLISDTLNQWARRGDCAEKPFGAKMLLRSLV